MAHSRLNLLFGFVVAAVVIIHFFQLAIQPSTVPSENALRGPRKPTTARKPPKVETNKQTLNAATDEHSFVLMETTSPPRNPPTPKKNKETLKAAKDKHSSVLEETATPPRKLPKVGKNKETLHAATNEHSSTLVETVSPPDKANQLLDAKLAALLPEWAASERFKMPTVHPGDHLTEQHSMLALTDTQFRSSPVGKLIEGRYGPPTQGSPTPESQGTCESDFGIELVQRWRSKGNTWCSSAGSDEQLAVQSQPSKLPLNVVDSSARSYSLKQANHKGDGDTLTEFHNVVFDTSPFCDLVRTRKVVEDFTADKVKMAYLPFKQKVVFGHCAVDEGAQRKSNFYGWPKEWTTAFQPEEDAARSALECAVWEEHPTILVQRDGFFNPYFATSDFLNTFIALAILDLPTNQVRVVLSDLFPWSIYEPLWKEVFGGGPSTMTAWEMKEHYGCQRVCFKRLILSIPGPSSPMTMKKHVTKCHSSPLFRAFSDYVVRGFGLHHLAQATLRTLPKSVVVTHMARRSSAVFPKKRFCDDRYFVCEEFEHMGIRPLSRTIKNDAELVRALKGLEGEKFKGGARVVFWDMDYNLTPFREQIAIDQQTDIMIGPHGAGLLHVLFMPDRGALIEIFIDSSQGNNLYHNHAFWSGRTGDGYQGFPSSNPVKVPDILNQVRRAVNYVSMKSEWDTK